MWIDTNLWFIDRDEGIYDMIFMLHLLNVLYIVVCIEILQRLEMSALQNKENSIDSI